MYEEVLGYVTRNNFKVIINKQAKASDKYASSGFVHNLQLQLK